MNDKKENKANDSNAGVSAGVASGPMLHVAPSPHFGTTGRSTQWMMFDVIIALVPALAVSGYVFGLAALKVIAVSVASCLATELAFQLLRRRPVRLLDGSALVTGLILAMSLPWTSPWWIPFIGGVVGVGLGKMVFGGLGANIFNPAMVGRAFLMICFAAQLASYTGPDGGKPAKLQTIGYTDTNPLVVTAATPMEAGKKAATELPDGTRVRVAFPLKALLAGNVNGSIGETGAIALILGGIYLCIRRTICWRIPLGAILAAMSIATLNWSFGTGVVLSPLHHLFGGALLIGVFFILTDPVTSPVSQSGRWVYGIGFGCLCMVIRLFSSYPEGVMFSVLLMNAITPLINRCTIPRPVGGRPVYNK